MQDITQIPTFKRPFICTEHGVQEDPYVCLAGDGYWHRSCKLCRNRRNDGRYVRKEKNWDRPYICSVCGGTEYFVAETTATGFQRRCRKCNKQRSSERYQRRSQDADWREQRNLRGRSKNRYYKQTVIDGYGGACECCGETEFAFLCIDHRFNDGKVDGRGYTLYIRLINEGFPKERYALLCQNCNFARRPQGNRPYDGKQELLCPHEVKRRAASNGAESATNSIKHFGGRQVGWNHSWLATARLLQPKRSWGTADSAVKE